jgi:nucleotide-binding universal stress UspA family protein
MKPVIVGIDESPAAQQALRWGVEYGRARGLPVTAVMAWDYIGQRHLPEDPGFDAHYNPHAAMDVLQRLVERAIGPGSPVRCEAVLDKPARALLEASADAELLVVGARGLGGFRGLLLGSVSRHLLHFATCPVAVVRHGDYHHDGPVVVGVNGSEASLRALRWAVSYSLARQRQLIPIYVWHRPHLIPPFEALLPDRPSAAADAQAFLERQLAQVDLGELKGSIDARAIEGAAAAEPLSASDGVASLVVVGARADDSAVGSLLGSVSEQVVHHATCPVVVVH